MLVFDAPLWIRPTDNCTKTLEMLVFDAPLPKPSWVRPTDNYNLYRTPKTLEMLVFDATLRETLPPVSLFISARILCIIYSLIYYLFIHDIRHII